MAEEKIVTVPLSKLASELADKHELPKKAVNALIARGASVDLRVGEDVVRSQRSYDTGLVVAFRDRAAHDAYQANPRHVTVAQFGPAGCESVVTVDFES